MKANDSNNNGEAPKAKAGEESSDSAEDETK